MTTKVLTSQEFYDIFKNEVQANASELTDFSEGSMNDILAGAFATAMNEISELVIEEFSKTYFDTANGPEITEGNDDLERLALDHFGDRFARPQAIEATVDITFSRPNTDAGDVVIAIDTIVKTVKDANGEEIRFKTTEAKTLTGTTIDVACEAVVGGYDGNVEAGTLTVLETALTDPSVTATNAVKAAGGDDAQDDSEYRETIRALIDSLAGATESAIRGAALAVPGVAFATVNTIIKPVIEWDIGGSTTIGDFFRIPYVELYVADEDGNSSTSLIELVEAAILPVRAAGVQITVKGGTSSSVNWDATITLNPAGPNYSTLSNDVTMILESMENYINEELGIGVGFDRILAKIHIMDIWGSGGTGDLDSFIINIPTGNISGVSATKLVAGTMSIS